MIKPKLRFFDLAMIIVSMVIGIGIFRNVKGVAESAGSESIFFLAWIVGGLVCICGALIFAEIGARFPVAGAYYKMFSLCYHPILAFMLIWVYLILNAGSTAAVALIAAQYIRPVILPASMQNINGDHLMFFIIITALFTLNFFGIRTGATTQNILSLVKIALMLAFISTIFFLPGVQSHQTNDAANHSSNNFFLALGASLIGIFFTYGGYQNTANLGGDVQQPQKNIPRAVFTAIIIVMVLYLAINVVYVRVLGFDTIRQSELIAADLARKLFGAKGVAFASVAIFISALGFINTELLYNPRVMYAMAQEGILPRIFMNVHNRKQVQEFALFFCTALIVVMFLLLQTFENLLNYVMFNDTLSFAFAAFCIFILRKKKVGDEIPGFRIKWYPFIPVIFILMQLVVTVNVAYKDPKNSFIAVCVMAVGLPFYFLLKKMNKKNTVSDSNS
ncbi:MAG TPA: amino acid permease [Chitinophagales bacterium]|nr:amino acid permease [Chitinophagales bacterium]